MYHLLTGLEALDYFHFGGFSERQMKSHWIECPGCSPPLQVDPVKLSEILHVHGHAQQSYISSPLQPSSSSRSLQSHRYLQIGFKAHKCGTVSYMTCNIECSKQNPLFSSKTTRNTYIVECTLKVVILRIKLKCTTAFFKFTFAL